jgi:hypothetical protein
LSLFASEWNKKLEAKLKRTEAVIIGLFVLQKQSKRKQNEYVSLHLSSKQRKIEAKQAQPIFNCWFVKYCNILG